MILTGGVLQRGHKVIDERLRNVFIRTADGLKDNEDWSYLFIDEANRLPAEAVERILEYVRKREIPCIMAYDPHILIDRDEKMADAERKIDDFSTLILEFTGNIRINRPVYSFLQSLSIRKRNLPE